MVKAGGGGGGGWALKAEDENGRLTENVLQCKLQQRHSGESDRKRDGFTNCCGTNATEWNNNIIIWRLMHISTRQHKLIIIQVMYFSERAFPTSSTVWVWPTHETRHQLNVLSSAPLSTNNPKFTSPHLSHRGCNLRVLPKIAFP